MTPVMIQQLLCVLLFTVVVNLPFGYWRRGLKKFTFRWLLAIHLPIPMVIALRIALGIPYATVPLVIAAAVGGQWAGGRFRKLPA